MWILGFLRLVKVVLVNVWLCFLVVASAGRFRFRPPFMSDSFPSIRLRRGGIVRLGRVKARQGLSLFADGGILRVADGTFFNNRCSVVARMAVSIGNDCLFGENASIYDHNHDFDPESGVSPDSFTEAPVLIGERCWIASGVIVLKGATIPSRTVIGAGAIVRKSIDAPGVYVAAHSQALVRLEPRKKH